MEVSIRTIRKHPVAFLRRLPLSFLHGVLLCAELLSVCLDAYYIWSTTLILSFKTGFGFILKYIAITDSTTSITPCQVGDTWFLNTGSWTARNVAIVQQVLERNARATFIKNLANIGFSFSAPLRAL